MPCPDDLCTVSVKIVARRGRIVGLVRCTRNAVWGQLHRGFESLSLRQIKTPGQTGCFYLAEREGFEPIKPPMGLYGDTSEASFINTLNTKRHRARA